MTRIYFSWLLAFAVLYPPHAFTADNDQALRKQRLEAQRQRQQQVNDRVKAVNESTRTFREYSNDLKSEYREQLKDLDTEFELRRVELKADHSARIAGAEAEYQKKLPNLFMNPEAEFTEETVKQMQAEARAYADELFGLKRQSAEELHQARIANEEKKNARLREMDQTALEEAASLGLTNSYAPILATPLGDGLTEQEQRWNEREKKAVVKLEEQNRRTLSEFRNGAALRKWEIDNLNEDFKLTWDEKAELHALQSEHAFYNTLFMQAAQAEQVDRQEIMAQIAELNEKTRLIKIEYRKVRDKNRITRREERKAILGK